jgi:nitrogen regulatory protein P-II 1
MAQLLVMVLDDPALLNEVLEAWTDAGVRGITVLDSTGVARLRRRAARNDLPTFLGFCRLWRTDQYCHCTLFAVVNAEIVERVVPVTTAIVGDFNAPHTGILLTLPVGQVWGLAKCCPQATEAQETA